MNPLRLNCVPLTLRASSGAVASVMLAACAVGPDFQRPDAPKGEAYTSEQLDSLKAGDGQTLAPGQNPAANWWTVFQSPALDSTMQQAFTGNRDLAAAAATLAESREVVNASLGALYPQVSLQAGAARQQYGAEFNGPLGLPPFSYFAIGPSVSYALDYTGGQHRAVEEQQADADEQDCELQAAYLSLSGNIVQQAVGIASAQAQIAAVEQLLAEDRKNLSLVQTAFEAGSVSKVDVVTAQSQLASDETQLPPLRQQLAQAQHALALLVGHTPADWDAPAFKLDELTLPASLPLSLPSELAHRRPDILAAEARLHAATAAVGVATAHLYPQISLTASWSKQSTSLKDLFNTPGAAWSVGAGLTAPIFEGGTLRAQKRAAQDELNAALARYQQVVLKSFDEVADVLSALDHDAEDFEAQRKALEASQASLDLTRESYKAGNVGVLQVLDAERQYQQARFGYIRAQAQRLHDSADLYLAMGSTMAADVAANP